MSQPNLCRGIVYTIQAGDTLYALSKRFRVPLAMILRANPYIDIYNLQIGSRVCIPVGGGRLPITIIPYVVKQGDTLSDILERFDLDLEDLLQYNDIASRMIAPGMTLQIPSEDDDRED